MIKIAEKELRVSIFKDMKDVEIFGNPERTFRRLSSIESVEEESLVFVGEKKYLEPALASPASVVLIKKKFLSRLTRRPEFDPICESKTFVACPNPRILFAIVSSHFKQRRAQRGTAGKVVDIHPDVDVSAVEIGSFVTIGKGCVFGEDVYIGSNSCIGENVRIGKGTYVYPNVTILENVEVGEHCIIHPSAVIGSDGFGYQFDDEKHLKIEQMGGVKIGNFVEIGSNTSIDRGTLQNTTIGDGVKIDNLVQIAHNVTVDSHTVIASLTGIAGGARIGKYCVLAGQVGIADSVVVEDKVICLARTGLPAKRYTESSVLMGNYCLEVGNYRRSHAVFKNLPELSKRVRTLEEKTGE